MKKDEETNLLEAFSKKHFPKKMNIETKNLYKA